MHETWCNRRKTDVERRSLSDDEITPSIRPPMVLIRRAVVVYKMNLKQACCLRKEGGPSLWAHGEVESIRDEDLRPSGETSFDWPRREHVPEKVGEERWQCYIAGARNRLGRMYQPIETTMGRQC